MTEQEKAIYMLKRLKAAGVSYKAFCEQMGLNVDSIYNYTRKPNTMAVETAEYIIFSIQEHYPKQWAFIIQKI